jgi:hypothetical protein
MTSYDVNVTRDGSLWAAVVVGLPTHVVGATDVEHFADLDTEVRDLIAGLTDAAPGSLDLRWQYVGGGRAVTEAAPGNARQLPLRHVHDCASARRGGRRPGGRSCAARSDA